MSAAITVGTWNGWVGQKPAKYARGVETILKQHDPDVLCLQEANRPGTLKEVRAVARDLSRKVVLQKGLGREGKSTVLLVDTDERILRRNGIVVREDWRGPMLGLERDGRTFPSVALDYPKMRVAGIHMPPGQVRNKEAFKACLEALEIKADKWTDKLILIGDWNAWWGQRGALSPHRLAKDIGGRVVRSKKARIDFAIVRGFSQANYKTYQKLGSDTHRYGILTVRV